MLTLLMLLIEMLPLSCRFESKSAAAGPLRAMSMVSLFTRLVKLRLLR